MPKTMKCRALVEFRFNSPGQGDGVIMKPGQLFLFDGFNATVLMGDGSPKKMPAYAIKDLEGEWFEKISEVTLRQAQQVQRTPEEMAIINAISGENNEDDIEPEQKTESGRWERAVFKTDKDKRIENSSPDQEPPIKQVSQPPVRKTEKGTEVVNDDANIVARTRKTVGEEESNSPAVSAKGTKSEKLQVEEDHKEVKNVRRIIESSEPKPQRKKLQIVEDNEGEVVKKVSIPAKNRDEVTENTKVEMDDQIIYAEGEEVKKTQGSTKGTPQDVGSSTQIYTTKTEKTGSKRSSKTGKKPGQTNLSNRLKVEDQDAKVVGKVRKKSITKTVDGITTTTTVGSNNPEAPKAEFSSSGDIDMGDVTFSSGGDTVVDINDQTAIDIANILND